MDRIPRVVAADVCGAHSLRLTFDDGLVKQVNLRRFLWGPMFVHLLDPAEFATVVVDQDAGTIVWPNEADFCPEMLHSLPDERDDAA